MLVFGGLLTWAVIAKQVVFRVLAACLAFVPAMLFGIAAVNKYYDYYQTWGAVASDFTNQGVQTLPNVPAFAGGSSKQFDGALGLLVNRGEAAQTGYLFQTTVTGKLSHIKRTVYVYLPPQYFQKAYAHYKFPAIELLHGSPGAPNDWINVMNVIPTFTDLIASHQADPAVLVVPDSDGGPRYSLQCLNAVNGIQDGTFVAEDVPNYIASHVRVQEPGKAWGISGYSEGGFCSANIALQNPTRYGFAGVLSGYFAPSLNQAPIDNKPGNFPHRIDPFEGNRALRLKNTPQKYIQALSAGTHIPEFWLAAGHLDSPDVVAAENFRQLLLLRQPVIPLDIVANGSHDATVWRSAVRPMLIWMTPQLAHQAQLTDAAAARAAEQKAKAVAEAHQQKPTQSAQPPGKPKAPKK
jgi:enterochelin esterase-like enzyme